MASSLGSPIGTPIGSSTRNTVGNTFGSTVGRFRRSAAIVALACSVPAAIAFTDQLHPYRQSVSVCVRVTAKEHLSGPALRTLQEEASRIWIRHGVALTWTQPVPTTCPTVVSLVFDEYELLKLAGGYRDSALARTVFIGRRQTIYVSVPRAFQMLTQLAQRNETLVGGGERDLRGGTLLGRVVAHELGHVLLTTLSHSEAGLMRPVFGLKDVLSSDDRTTDLSSVETSRLEMRFSLVRMDSPTRTAAPSVLARSEISR
jgi:hypothetical protein